MKNENKDLWQQKIHIHKSEPVYCTHFGCGRILTLKESMISNKCYKHVNENGDDLINKWLEKKDSKAA